MQQERVFVWSGKERLCTDHEKMILCTDQERRCFVLIRKKMVCTDQESAFVLTRKDDALYWSGTGAYEGFCLGGAQLARVSAPKKIFGQQYAPPLKTPFWKNIDTFSYFFLPPPTWTCFVHHKNTINQYHSIIKNYIFTNKQNFFWIF